MDLKKGQKQGTMKEARRLPNICCEFLQMSGNLLAFFHHALFLSFFRSIGNWNEVLQKPFLNSLVYYCTRLPYRSKFTLSGTTLIQLFHSNMHVWSSYMDHYGSNTGVVKSHICSVRVCLYGNKPGFDTKKLNWFKPPSSTFWAFQLTTGSWC